MNKRALSSRSDTGYLIISILYSIGIILFCIPELKTIAHTTTDIFLFLTHTFIFILIVNELKSKKLIVWFLGVSLFTYLLEIAGVKTGIIFGTYEYGNGFLFRVFDVPLVIGINWAILILTATGLAQRIAGKGIHIPFIAAGLITTFDVIMEPVAMKIDFWNWTNGTVPLQNYACWFIIAWIASYFIRELPLNKPVVFLYFIVQIVFFGILHIIVV